MVLSRKELFSLIILIAVIGFGTFKYFTREYTETRSRYLMDTIVEITASSKSKLVGTEIDSVFNFINHLQDKLDEYNPNSLISKINRHETRKIDVDVYNLLVIADSLYRMTDGRFDISVKPVWDLWGFNTSNPMVPDSVTINNRLSFVGFHKIKYTKDHIHLPDSMQVTFGALAKGYILDQAREYLRKREIFKGYLNCRSSMTFFGNKLPPLVYIQHPRNPDDIIASFRVNNLSVGTSGDYQQFFEYDNKRYHHLINALTGMPVEDVYSVTVTNPSAAWADGLSTALFLMNSEKAIDVAKAISNTNAVIYFRQNDATVSLKTEGMKTYGLSEKL